MRRTALQQASLEGRVRMVELLVDAGANVRVQGKSWAQLMEGKSCGRRLDTASAYNASPAELTSNSSVLCVYLCLVFSLSLKQGGD